MGSKFWHPAVRDLCTTAEGPDFHVVVNEPPQEFHDVVAWALRYTTQHARQARLSVECSNMGRFMGARKGIDRPLDFRTSIFRPKHLKGVTVHQQLGGQLTARCWRDGVRNIIYEGAVTVEQAKAILRWAAVSSRTCRVFPHP